MTFAKCLIIFFILTLVHNIQHHSQISDIYLCTICIDPEQSPTLVQDTLVNCHLLFEYALSEFITVRNRWPRYPVNYKVCIIIVIRNTQRHRQKSDIYVCTICIDIEQLHTLVQETLVICYLLFALSEFITVRSSWPRHSVTYRVYIIIVIIIFIITIIIIKCPHAVVMRWQVFVLH